MQLYETFFQAQGREPERVEVGRAFRGRFQRALDVGAGIGGVAAPIPRINASLVVNTDPVKVQRVLYFFVYLVQTCSRNKALQVNEPFTARPYSGQPTKCPRPRHQSTPASLKLPSFWFPK